jgi:hypothetical protein
MRIPKYSDTVFTKHYANEGVRMDHSQAVDSPYFHCAQALRIPFQSKVTYSYEAPLACRRSIWSWRLVSLGLSTSSRRGVSGSAKPAK